ncbi:TonB-dependent receptor [Flavobacterium sp. F-65]|uniref:TonB-dependent receptor n=1 Tax=Flavobacterium pisciphilum TaxID=2893755 RepID=A0ABS8MP23_9FLAO|nr:TonB-dependent receptor [Flavobacterium sp. F-65]MCC9070520.1 TonB-dependent receptor [Flavobacterium sp. F-65]
MNNDFSRQFAFWVLFLGLFFGANTIYSQTGTVSVDFKNSSPQKIIDNLKSRTPYQFIYQKDLDLSLPLVTLKKENVTIDEILNDLQNQTNLNFRRNENNIAVNRKDVGKKKKKGKIVGKVVDANGLSLPGANIKVIEAGFGVQSDIDGSYVVELDPGEYSIEVSIISFQSQKITGVKVSEGGEVPLVVSLKEDAESLNEVVIIQNYKQATASVQGLLLQQKKAAQFSDGISAEQIARTPDKDVGSSLKRITGVTTIDNKYVVVRSMGERWNQAVMDGISLPSTDAYQQNFSFDIIPTAMVESIVVSKTATPDMYANFAGGYVEIKTKDIPKENFTSFSVSSSYNSRSAFKERLTKQEGDYDYLGFDDGRRDYPYMSPIEVPINEAASGPFIEQSKKFTEDNFSTYKTYAAPGTTLQFALGRSYSLKDNNKWGFVGSLLFKNTQEKLDIEHTERGRFLSNTRFSQEGVVGRQYSVFEKYGFKNRGANYNYNSTLGGMFNAAIQLGKHKITTRNTAMHIYNNQLNQITGWDKGTELPEILNGTGLPSTTETNYPVYQTFIQNKIEGNHRFEKLEINWYTAYGKLSKDTKDATFLETFRKKVGDDELVYHQVYNSGGRFPFSRDNYTNDESDYNWAINFDYSFNLGEIATNDIKAGYFGTYKKATNQQRSAKLVTVGQGTTNRADIYDPLSKFLDGSQYYYGGFGWEDYGKYGNKYEGDVKVHSPYLMLDNKIGSFLRLVWGARAESYIYSEISNQFEAPGAFPLEKEDKKWQFLPSASLTISPTNKMNVRLGYNKSVLRPQFAERVGTPYYDPIRSAKILNWSAGMISSVSNNYDLKFEWYPSGGEILSFGVYHKNIDDPIESIGTINGNSGIIYNLNSNNAKLWGIEMEFYKSLSFLGEGPILKKLFVSGNASFNATKVTSYVNVDGTGGLYKANRPLYGQSPYTYNLGLDYVGDRMGFSVRHNAIGDQYILVGFDYSKEEIRMPYAVTDAQVSYKFFKEKNLELKCSMKNMFDAGIQTYNNANSYSHIEDVPYGSNPRDRYSLGANATNKYDEGIDQVIFKAWSGRTISVSVNYSF